MTEILKNQLRVKINNLEEIYSSLVVMRRFTLKDLEKDIEKTWAVTFGIVAGVEAILDIGQYVLADRRIKFESYGDVSRKLFKIGIIDEGFSLQLQKMISFRNRAIHNYPSLEAEYIHNILQKDINDFKTFLKIVSELQLND